MVAQPLVNTDPSPEDLVFELEQNRLHVLLGLRLIVGLCRVDGVESVELLLQLLVLGALDDRRLQPGEELEVVEALLIHELGLQCCDVLVGQVQADLGQRLMELLAGHVAMRQAKQREAENRKHKMVERKKRSINGEIEMNIKDLYFLRNFSFGHSIFVGSIFKNELV